MKFMITFALDRHGYQERVSRFLETGAPAPDGVEMLGRWFTASHSRGFILVETSDASLLFRYASEWAELIDFQIEPIVLEDEAAPILQDLAQAGS